METDTPKELCCGNGCEDCVKNPVPTENNMIKTYRKKPAEVEAVLFTLYAPNYSALDIAKWCNGRFDFSAYDTPAKIFINTPEGVMTASEGDYIIKGIHGEFYPCKPDIFKKTYKAV